MKTLPSNPIDVIKMLLYIRMLLCISVLVLYRCTIQDMSLITEHGSYDFKEDLLNTVFVSLQQGA